MSQKITPKILLIALGIIALIGLAYISYTATQSSKSTNVSPTPTTKPFKAGTVRMSPPVKDTPVTGQIIVKFKPQYTDAQITDHLTIYKARISKKIEGINQTVVKVPAGQENAVIKKLQDDEYIESAQRDYTTHALSAPNDEGFPNQWALSNTGQNVEGTTGTLDADIHAENAWDVTRGAGIKVAVLDTGINLNHPDLAGKVIAQKAFETSTIEDSNGHGTHVAGIIAADTDNTIGIAGVCPDCQLIIGKVVDDEGTGTTSDATAGITWAADQGAKVINMSIGTNSVSTQTLYQQAIAYATQKGAVVVAASGNGNSSSQMFPAAINGVISVAATDSNDQKASYSNYGSWVQIAAPGTNILSTLPTHTNEHGVLNYGYDSGTSMAGPVVAGVAALIASTSYGTTPQALTDRLYATADKVSGTGTYWVHGRVDAAKAVGTVIANQPSFICVGGAAVPPCATIPPTIYTIGGTAVPTETITVPTTTPASITTTLVPSEVTTSITSAPSSTISPTITSTPPQNPCSTTGKNSQKKGHHKGGFLSSFFQFFLKIIAFFLQLIGVTPPSSSPCPSQQPSTNVTPTPSTSVSVAPSISTEPSTPVTTISPSPSISSTPSNLPVLTGPFGNNCTPGHIYCNGHVITGGAANTLYVCQQNQSPTVSKKCATSCTVKSSGNDICK